MHRYALGTVMAACLVVACSGASPAFALSNASVDSTFTCPVGSDNALYDIHATVDAHNGTAGAVIIKSVSADLTLEAVSGPWLEKVGDKYQASNVMVAPPSVAAGANANLKVTIPSACTNAKATNGASYGDYRITLHFATSAGNFSISSKTNHRLTAA